MTILMSNTYTYDREADKLNHNFTGFIGAFDTREKAMEVWNDTLREFGVPEDKLQMFAPSEIIGNQFVPVNEIGKWAEKVEDVRFTIELMSKDTEMNKVWRKEDI